MMGKRIELEIGGFVANLHSAVMQPQGESSGTLYLVDMFAGQSRVTAICAALALGRSASIHLFESDDDPDRITKTWDFVHMAGAQRDGGTHRITRRIPESPYVNGTLYCDAINPNNKEMADIMWGVILEDKKEGVTLEERYHAILNKVSPVPLMPQWTTAIIEHQRERDEFRDALCIGEAPPAYIWNLRLNDLQEWIPTMVKEGRLRG